MAREPLIPKEMRTRDEAVVIAQPVPTRIVESEFALAVTEAEFTSAVAVTLTVEQSKDGVTWQDLTSATFVGGGPPRVGFPFNPSMGLSLAPYRPLHSLRTTLIVGKAVALGVDVDLR